MGLERIYRARDQKGPLAEVLDFGQSPAELREIRDRKPPTAYQITTSLISEAKLNRMGRWEGAPPPLRRPFNFGG